LTAPVSHSTKVRAVTCSSTSRHDASPERPHEPYSHQSARSSSAVSSPSTTMGRISQRGGSEYGLAAAGPSGPAHARSANESLDEPLAPSSSDAQAPAARAKSGTTRNPNVKRFFFMKHPDT
jgi:hypothetical protein